MGVGGRIVYSTVRTQLGLTTSRVLPEILPSPEPKVRRLSLLMMVFWSGLVSVYDNVLNLLAMDILKEREQNPLASYIIQYWGVEGLICIKAFTTIVAVLLMVRLVYSRWRIVTVPVFIFQSMLFCYLTFYTESRFWARDMFLPLEMVIEFYRCKV